MTAIAIVVVDAPSGGLLWIESEFSVALTAFRMAARKKRHYG